MQDPTTKDWWVSVEKKEIGYFPASLFSNMAYVDEVAWMGITSTPLGTPSPSMGCGELPMGISNHGSFFKNPEFVNDFGQNQPLEKDEGHIYTSQFVCFGAEYIEDRDVGLLIEFGGPAGCNA